MNQEKWVRYLMWHQSKGGCCCPKIVDRHSHRLPKPETHPKLLDIGSGTNHYIEYFESKGYDVRGIDMFYSMDKVTGGDMHEMPFQEREFDIIFCNQVFEHSIAPPILALEMNRVLKLNGIVFITIPSTRTLKWMKMKAHHLVLTKDQMTILFNKVGFSLDFYSEDKEDPEKGEDQWMQTFIFKKTKDVGV